jgi:hypothetical protein
MEEEIKNKAVVRIGGETFSLDESQTGKFGITKGEFRILIKNIIAGTPSGSCSQRDLLKHLLKRMNIKTHSGPRDEYFKEYLKLLSEMKDEKLVEFVSCRTKMHVRVINNI